MNSSFVQEHIPRRMREMGFGRDYRVEMQTWFIPAASRVIKPLYNVWAFFPVEFISDESLKVESDFGYLDFSATHNEVHYEHTGRVIIDNTKGTGPSFVAVILAIPIVADRTQPLTIAT